MARHQAVTKQLGQVAEGVNTLKLVVDKAKENDIYMSLASGLHDIIFSGLVSQKWLNN